MRKIFQQDLTELGEDLTAMALKVRDAVDRAGKALRNVDLERAERVIAADDEIDALEDRIEKSCLHMLLLQGPVATDLRLVVSAMRMSGTLERMGDLARHVASISRRRYPNPVATGELYDVLCDMSVSAAASMQLLVELMDSHKLELCEEIARHDDILDRALREVFAILAQDENLTRQEVVDAVLLSRFLERLGDHAGSGAKRISYLVTGDLDASISAVDPNVDEGDVL